MSNNKNTKKKKHKRKTKRKQKDKVRHQRQMTHLQRRRCIQRNTSIRTPHGRTPPPKKTATRQAIKKPLFSPVFGHPGGVGKFLRIIFFWRRTKPKTKKQEKWAKKQNPKIGKHCFSPDFLMVPKGRVNKRSGGGRFFDTARSQTNLFDPLFWGSNFKGRVYTNDIILQKIGVSALFGVPRNERKSSNFKS